MPSKKDALGFAKRLRKAGLVVDETGAGEFVIKTGSGQLLGAFGWSVAHGKTRNNICAQVKRATGITVT